MTMPGLAASLTSATRTTPTIDDTTLLATLRNSDHDTCLIRYQGRTILAGNLTRQSAGHVAAPGTPRHHPSAVTCPTAAIAACPRSAPAAVA